MACIDVFLEIHCKKISKEGKFMKQFLRQNVLILLLLILTVFWLGNLLLWALGPLDTVGPANPSPFGPVGPLFSDFYQIAEVSKYSRPYDLGATNYPATLLFGLKLLSGFNINTQLFILMINFALFSKYLLSSVTPLSQKNKITLYFFFIFSYPFLLGVFRGNFDVLAVSLLFVAFYFREKSIHFAGIFLGLAISIKYWPIIFVVFFWKFSHRKISKIAFITFTSITLTSSILLGYKKPSEIIFVFLIPLQSQSLELSANHAAYSTSAVGLMLATFTFFTDPKPWDLSNAKMNLSLDFTNHNYFILQIFLALLCTLVFIFSKKQSSVWITCSIFASLIPTISYAYRIESILVGVILLLSDNTASKMHIEFQKNFRIQCALIFGILLPWTLVYIPNSLFSLQSVLAPVFQIALIILIVSNLTFPERFVLFFKRQLQFE